MRTKVTRKTTLLNTKCIPRKRIGRLKTSKDVAIYIARCIKKAEKGEGDANGHYKRVMMASMLLKAIEASDMESRIEALEQQMLGRHDQ